MSALYRIRQFVRALTARISPQDRDLVGRLLPEPAVRLFDSLPLQDQRHGLDVAQSLIEQGEVDPDLLAAALLHDAGKARAGLTVFHRSIAVLLEASRHRDPMASGHGADRGWRRPFWVQEHHPELGASLARDAGCSEATVWLIYHHHSECPRDLMACDRYRRLLEVLQRIDASS